MDLDTSFMQMAIQEAKLSYQKNEVPVGAILVKDNIIVSKGHNLRETEQNTLNHAEMIAINEYCKKYKTWRLSGLTMYVNLEPCIMCMGALLEGRITRLVYSLENSKNTVPIEELCKKHNHKIIITKGVCEIESKLLLNHFFKKIRG